MFYFGGFLLLDFVLFELLYLGRFIVIVLFELSSLNCFILLDLFFLKTLSTFQGAKNI